MSNLRPTRWWRVIRDGELISESSDEAENRAIHAEFAGSTLQRLYEPEPVPGQWIDEPAGHG